MSRFISIGIIMILCMYMISCSNQKDNIANNMNYYYVHAYGNSAFIQGQIKKISAEIYLVERKIEVRLIEILVEETVLKQDSNDFHDSEILIYLPVEYCEELLEGNDLLVLVSGIIPLKPFHHKDTNDTEFLSVRQVLYPERGGFLPFNKGKLIFDKTSGIAEKQIDKNEFFSFIKLGDTVDEVKNLLYPLKEDLDYERVLTEEPYIAGGMKEFLFRQNEAGGLLWVEIKAMYEDMVEAYGVNYNFIEVEVKQDFYNHYNMGDMIKVALPEVYYDNIKDSDSLIMLICKKEFNQGDVIPGDYDGILLRPEERGILYFKDSILQLDEYKNIYNKESEIVSFLYDGDTYDTVEKILKSVASLPIPKQ